MVYYYEHLRNALVWFLVMKTTLLVIQMVSALSMIVCVLLQNRGTGIGAAFGGDGNIYRTKRGVEKGLFIVTILFSTLFIASSLAAVILQS